MITESYVPPGEIRERRALVRGRKRLIEKRTDFKNEVYAVLDHHGIEYSWSPFSEEGQELLAGEELSLGSVGQNLIESYLAVIDELTIQIERLEDVIEDCAVSLEETQLLITISGVSFYSSLLITAEVGEIDRFDTTDYDGHETFWAVASDTTANVPSKKVIAEFFPDVKVRNPLNGSETLFDMSKDEELLDWIPNHR